MRNPEVVLNSLQEHSCDMAYKYDRLYRNLYNREFYLLAYQNIYANKGSMTAGTDSKTIDAMSLERIDRLIESLKDESYMPAPSRRVFIPKKNGKLRPLGIPSIDDKLVQEVVRILLEAIYEGSFEDTSHGFRPNRSCHTALEQIQRRYNRCIWFVEGDIKGFFDNIDHETMVGILRKRIQDERFIRLIRKFLNAGYMQDMEMHRSYSGTPQGGIISPILANVYLDQFDKYMKTYKQGFDKGTRRKLCREYTQTAGQKRKIVLKLRKAEGRETRQFLSEQWKALDEKHKCMQCTNPMDVNFKRIQYTRYADDFIIGVIGSKDDARRVKEDIGEFIAGQLHLELSAEKTLITKATDRARFLGYDIRVTAQRNQTKRNKNGVLARSYNGRIFLEVPKDVIRRKLLELGAMKIKMQGKGEHWTPLHRGALVCRNDLSILDQYNAETRGFCNYYRFANNSGGRLHRFRFIMEYSFYKTLACKYRTSTAKIISKYRIGKDRGVRFHDRHGQARVRLFWKGSLKRDKFPKPIETDFVRKQKGEHYYPSLGTRLKANRCEWCGRKTHDLVVHQVKALKEISDEHEWARFMKSINRKTLVVCMSCHTMIHSTD
jgi:group II intron reverse transcriptase/maturase